MSAETPLTPREEIEVRITAFLMGELSPEEGAALQAQVSADPELSALQARLQEAAGLLREASALSERPATLRLSSPRRERLLQHFQHEAAAPAPAAKRSREWAWGIQLAAAAALIALLGGIALWGDFTASQRSAAVLPSATNALELAADGDNDSVVKYNRYSRPLSNQPGTPYEVASRQLSNLSAGGPGSADASHALHEVGENGAVEFGIKRSQFKTEESKNLVSTKNRNLSYLDKTMEVGRAKTDELNSQLAKAKEPSSPALYDYSLSTPAATAADELPLAQNDLSAIPLPSLSATMADRVGGAAKPAQTSVLAAGIVPAAPAPMPELSEDATSFGMAPGAAAAPAAPASPPLTGGRMRDGNLAASDNASDALFFAPPELGKKELPQAKPEVDSEKLATAVRGEARSGAKIVQRNVAVPAQSEPEAKPQAAQPAQAADAVALNSPPVPALRSNAEGRGGNGYGGNALGRGVASGLDPQVATAVPPAGAASPAEPEQILGLLDRRNDTPAAESLAKAGATDAKAAPARDLQEIDQKLETQRIIREMPGGAGENHTRSYAQRDLDKSGNRPMRKLAESEAVDERKPAATAATPAVPPVDVIMAAPTSAAPQEPAPPQPEIAAAPVPVTRYYSSGILRPDPASQPPAATPQPEVATAANPFSTFSLNVSDVSFKLAAASLERSAMPEPASIRSEEFINALDYHDPEPAPGVPLAFAEERARYPFAQNRDVLRLAVKTAAAGRAAGRPLNVVLLLDNSGSMERADRVEILHEALRQLSAQLHREDILSIVTFARTPRLWADGVSGDKAAETTARVGEITPQGGTNLEAALDLGYATALRHAQAGSISRVVLLTDGAANLGEVDPAALRKKVEAHRLQGVALDCFGIGWEGYNDDLLEQLSRHGDGRYGFINTPEEAADGFAAQLAGALRVAAADVKVQVEFNPRRVTAYRQIGYARHQLTKEQFRDNSVDAAEIGAAESGNALYVVEVNPEGTGDLATVRVRFKVPGTSDYREHEWPVPFQAVASSLEQASPALRLATVASAFSEMLAGSPFAAEVTSDRLLGYLNGVPAIYAADPRPLKLEWMLRQTKSLSGR